MRINLNLKMTAWPASSDLATNGAAMRKLSGALLLIGSLLSAGALAGEGSPALFPPAPATPAAEDESSPDRQTFAVHGQVTAATQAHPSFQARYTGNNSMLPEAESATSLVADLFAGVRPWRGAELYVQPELTIGGGLSSSFGVAAYPSGEVYRVGSPDPTLYLARLFLRQVIRLGGGKARTEPGPNQLGGAHDRDTLTFLFGKLMVLDTFDNNSVSNDSHTRFMSWATIASGAFDYAGDTRGYTWGASADLTLEALSLRAGVYLEPLSANLLTLEWNPLKSQSLVLECERRFEPLPGLRAAVRALVFRNNARMGRYDEAMSAAGPPDVALTRAYGRNKYGFAASWNQELTDTTWAFARVSANDGATETWAYTEIDRSLAVGAVRTGSAWGRPRDEAGASLVVSGLSGKHRAYLAKGGYGFIIGDGALGRYGSELLAELYYRAQLGEHLQLSALYQPVVNPAYNTERGPIHIFTARVHLSF